MRFATSSARRVLTASALLLASSLVIVAAGSAARPQASGAEGLIQPQWTPLGLRDDKATVVVQLAGDPVTVVEGNSGRSFNRAEKESIKGQLKSKQDALRDDIASLGGAVLADYQVAYNGLKVRVDRSKLNELAALPGVTAVRGLQLMKPDNERGVQLIGGPLAWAAPGNLHGEGVKIAVIDTGIDYTHANFGGPGTTAAYDAANAADTLPPSPAQGWGMRVKGGVDLVGDDYNADPDSDDYQPVPHPDPNPLDCNGHGSHVAGSAAGSGVTAAGATYTGPYNATTITGSSWTIGPGVAPKADIYGVRVFGCEGSTDVTVDAIEWAVDNDMDVINMSLGSSFGSTQDPSAVAATNAAKAGVVVVTSAGNSGPSQYITGSPGTAEGAISTAAIDSTPTFPGVAIALSGGQTLPAINANLFNYTGPIAGLTVVRISNNPATPEDESIGCSKAAFGTLPPNALAVVNRGVCARVAKAIFGEQAGAKAVAMVNNASPFPPVEGPITSNPDTGEPFTVTIPFLGLRGPFTDPASDGSKLRAADGQSATLTAGPVANPNYLGFADFSSGGPRTGDSGLKPNVSAPGVGIVSTGVGTGNKAATISGTSMASPHTAGVAVLTRQAHPSWSVEEIKAAIVNTADPAQVTGLAGYRVSRGGSGLVQAAKATGTQAVALAEGDKFAVNVNYGFEELKKDFSKTRAIRVVNNGSAPVTFDLSVENPQGSPHTVSFNTTSVTVNAGASRSFNLRLDVPVGTVGNSDAFREVAGIVKLTPAAGGNNGIALRVPYYLVPRALSDIQAGRTSVTAAGVTASLSNKGAITGTYDGYAWGLEDRNESGKAANDIRTVGVQSFPFPSAADPNRKLLVFAINVGNRWSNAAVSEYDLPVDVNGDDEADFTVVAVDAGAVTAGSFNGIMGAFVFSDAGATQSPFAVAAPHDSSTLLVPILSSQLCIASGPCLSTSNPRFEYTAVGFDLTETEAPDEVFGTAKYNPFTPALETGQFGELAPGASASVPAAINNAEWAQSGPLGLMFVALDNKAGRDEAVTIRIRR
jgi:subtilisin family serine protease